MNWINFPYIAIPSIILLVISSLVVIVPINKRLRTIIANISSVLAILLFVYFIISLWINLDRPPLRTLGETRLWYAFFLPIIGIITFNRWKFFWFLGYSNLMAIVFIIINLTHPETYSKTLMPALQSYWFVPHVVVYILSYAVFGVSWIVSIVGLVNFKKKDNKKLLQIADNIVFIGFAFLTLGLLFGALWAKEAWGHYWTWDPKETWALLTFLVYLIYIHLRSFHKGKVRIHFWVLSISFIFLLAAWFGVNYMPSAKNSVHTYSQQE